jgi:16S rRNA processing protein RimM
MISPADTTRIGYFLKPHGLQGGIKVYTFNSPKHLLKLKRIWLEGHGWLSIVHAELSGLGAVLFLPGISNHQAAQALHGLQIYAADSELPVLEAGCYYYHELRNLPVYDATDTRIGEISDIIDGGHQDLLVIKHSTGEDLVPLQAPYVVLRHNQAGKPQAIELTKDTPIGLLTEDEG